MFQNEDSSTESDYEKVRKERIRVILDRDARFRLFQQMHQNPIDAYIGYEAPHEIEEKFGLQGSIPLRRAAGGALCKLCGVQFRYHPKDEENPLFGDGFDIRLCSGQIVHL